MKNIIFLTILVLILGSCQQEEYEESNPQEDDLFKQEIAFPDKKGDIFNFETKNSTKIYFEKIENYNVFEGDIILDDRTIIFLKKEDSLDNINNSNFKKNGPSPLSAPAALFRRWDNSTVNFKISISNRRNDILWAINHIKTNTNLDFKEKATGDYIDFVSSDGCSSYIGVRGSRQPINLANGCGRGSIVHEICHALGIFHEQSRPDRSNHITINWNNIESGRAHNFKTEAAHNYGVFDFNSIMLYSSWAFSKNNNPTITKRNGSTFFGQRNGLSTNDINVLRDMYPGPNMVKHLENTIDIGANENGDVAFARRRRSFVDIYKNNKKIKTIRTSNDISLDITNNGTVLTTNNTFQHGRGKYRRYRMIDISEGGGYTYCIATNSRETKLFKRNGNNWVKLNKTGKRLTVDKRSRVWVLSDKSISFVNGSELTTIPMPAYSSIYDRLIDIGTAGNEVYVSMINVRSKQKQLLKYSEIANQLIRQPGSANRLDGQANGIVWKN